jgi:hypothetical protein
MKLDLEGLVMQTNQITVATLQQPLKMREAIKQKLNFYQWLKLQTPKPHKSEHSKLQLTYEALEDALTPSLQKVIPQGQFIVTQSNGWPIKSEQEQFTIHLTRQDAEQHGKVNYQYANFRVIPFPVFIHTQIGKYLQRYQETLIRLKAKRKSKQREAIPKLIAEYKFNKAKQDSIKHLEGLLVKAEIKVNLPEIKRLKKQIERLKK